MTNWKNSTQPNPTRPNLTQGLTQPMDNFGIDYPNCWRTVEVQRQVDELLRFAFIRPFPSPMASHVVCALKGEDKTGGVRLAIDYRFLNASSTSDAYILPHLGDLIQKVGKKRFNSNFECRSAHSQFSVRESHQFGLFSYVRSYVL